MDHGNRAEVLRLAGGIAATTASWTAEQKERLEAAREACRTVVEKMGLSKETQCLGDLWTMLTIAYCQRHGLPGTDVTVSSIGLLPSTTAPVSCLKNLNVHHMAAFTDELRITMTVLKDLRLLNVDFFASCEKLLDQVLKVVLYREE